MSALKLAETRPIRRAKPTGDKFDAKQAVDSLMDRYPIVMARLAE